MRKKKQKSDTRIFFTSDLWLGRNNIIDIYNRPFKNIDEMDNTLINKWNLTVSNNDIVFVLGNIVYDSAHIQNTLTDLTGTKVLMLTESDKTVFRVDDTYVEDLMLLQDIYSSDNENDTDLYDSFGFLTSDEIFDSVINITERYHPNVIILKNSIIDIARYGITLSLYPLMEWNGKSSGTLNLHGGTETSSKDFNTDNRLSVRTDFWDFRPIALDEIQLLISQLKTK